MRSHSTVTLLLLGFAAQAAFACSCVPPPPLSSLVADAKHVFVARVTSAVLSDDGTSVEAAYVAEEALKGDPAKVARIKAAFDKGQYELPEGRRTSCPPLFVAPGMHFLVFAPDDGPATYGHCTATQPLNKREDLSRLKSVLRQKE